MFEKYTEKARRVIFFARYEAAQFGSPYIESEHLLLGLLREDKVLTNRFLRSRASVESIRKQIEGHATIREKLGNADLPLSNESKRVLAYAAEESERLSAKHIGTEHLLLGLFREEKCFAAQILIEHGLKLSVVREELARKPHESAPRPSPESTTLGEFSRDLTRAAIDGELEPLIGRDQELAGVIEVLCSFNRRNPILIGERGAGKTAIVGGLAQRIADGAVPTSLADRRILALDLSLIAAGTKYREQVEERLKTIIKGLTESQNAILFIDEAHTLFGAGSTGSLDAADILKPALSRGDIQCISASTPSDYRKLVQATPWFEDCFRSIDVPPLDEEKTLLVLHGRKLQYEKFHGVTYTDEALQHAAHYCVRYFPDSTLPKAIEVLDTAGSRVKLRQTSLPEEVLEVQKRIKLIVRRMEQSIVNHEFEKARFHSDEERKERENLLALHEKYHLDKLSTGVVGVVGREDIEDAVSRWTGAPIASVREEHVARESARAVRAIVTPATQEIQTRSTLRVFLCHSSNDKPAVRDLYIRLKNNQVDPWLDEENLLHGQEFDYEISNAVRSCHVVIVCLSAHSVNKSGYLQKEIRKVLDVAEEQPEGTIYVIPLKLEECEVPSRLRRWHWVNFFEAKGFEKLMQSLHERARAVGLTLQ